MRISSSAARSILRPAHLALFAASFALLISISAQPATAQSRVIQKWVSTVNDPVDAESMTLVLAAAADSNGDVAVAGNICVALNPNFQCSNQEFQVESYDSSGKRLWGSSIEPSYSEQGSVGPGTTPVNTATAVVFDSSNDVYAAGPMYNALEENGSHTVSIMIVKYSPSGARQWIRYDGPYQNSQWDACAPVAITTDQQNNLYVTGRCAIYGGTWHVQILKYSPSGQLLWIGGFTSITDYNGNARTDFMPVGIAVYNSTAVYVTGQVGNTVGDIHPVTLKYDENGNIVWQRMAYGSIASLGFPDTPHSITLDSAGNIYEEGSSGSDGPAGAYALKYDPSGDLLWLSQAQEPDCTSDYRGQKTGDAVGLDARGNVYLTSDDCSAGVVVTKFDSNGNLLWESQTNGITPIASSYFNSEGDAYVLANANSKSTAFETVKYDSDGNRQWLIAYSGSGSTPDNMPVAMAASGGNLYIAGGTGGSYIGPTAWATIDYVQDAADATPTSLAFPTQTVDTTSSAQPIILKNTSPEEDLDIEGIEMAGPFSETNNCSSEIVPGGTCTIEVRYTPTSTGTQSGSLSVDDTWAGSPDVVTLRGTASEP